MLGSTPHSTRKIFDPPCLIRLCTKMLSINRNASIQASSHTSLFSVNFLEKIEQEMATKTVLYTDIPSKSRHVSPMDFCSFVVLKYASSKHRRLCGLGKLFKRNGTKYHSRYNSRHYCHGSYDVERL
ncbi:hypothetical protein AVEN_259523-1 [Araneus ventricosus]|uniref:Uncharacterized protein n=1 Tax=Araneus ventricosus TaxID=182803 RepID=A0A4Y2D5U7_ARAVE|nr:hypothetical protein AVEN_259523-1 [Araneus ventricosus]